MNEARRQERADAFVLSMVDLFGCGFIAAVFLFILNAVQPTIDAEQSAGQLSARGAADSGTGVGGPLRVEVELGTSVSIGTVSEKLAKWWDSSPGDTAFVIPRAESVRWPATVTLAKSPSIGPERPFRLRVTGGGQTAIIAVYASAVPNGMQPELTLIVGRRIEIRPNFSASVDLQVDLLPDRTARSAYLASFRVLSGTTPALGAQFQVHWLGGGRKVKLTDRSAAGAVQTWRCAGESANGEKIAIPISGSALVCDALSQSEGEQVRRAPTRTRAVLP